MYVNRKVLANALANGQPIASVVGRGVGRTTSVLLTALGGACACPLQPVLIAYSSYETARWASKRAQELIASLGLQDVTVEVVHNHDPVLQHSPHRGGVSHLCITSRFAEPLQPAKPKPRFLEDI